MKLCVVVVCTSVVVLPVFVEMLPNQLGKGAAAIAAPCYTRETGCGGVQSLTPLNYDSGIDVNIAEERKNNEAEEEEEERLAFIPGASTTRVTSWLRRWRRRTKGPPRSNENGCLQK